jgi:hypothetical protein
MTWNAWGDKTWFGKLNGLRARQRDALPGEEFSLGNDPHGESGPKAHRKE